MADFGEAVGVILTGGGFKGAFQPGCLEVMEKAGIKYQIVQGISVGAFNAAGLVADGAASLKEKWQKVERDGYSAIFSRWDAIKHMAKAKNALYSNEGLYNLIYSLDAQRLLDSGILLEIVVWDEIKDSPAVISNHKCREDGVSHQDIYRFIKASASFPGLFQPERFGSDVYSDGRVFVLDSFAQLDTVFIIDTGQPSEDLDSSFWPWNLRLFKGFSSLIDYSMSSNLRLFASQNDFQFYPEEEMSSWNVMRRFKDILKTLFTGKKRIVVIKPSINISTLRLDYFKKGDLSRIHQHGVDRTREILDKVFGS